MERRSCGEREVNWKVTASGTWLYKLSQPLTGLSPVPQAHRSLPLPGQEELFITSIKSALTHSARHFEESATHSLRFVELGTDDLLLWVTWHSSRRSFSYLCHHSHDIWTRRKMTGLPSCFRPYGHKDWAHFNWNLGTWSSCSDADLVSVNGNKSLYLLLF